MKTSPARDYHHGNLRAELVERARARVERDGLDSFSLRDLAKEIGVSPNAPYRHFQDRGDLLAAVAQVGFEELAERSEAVEGPPARRLSELGDLYVDFALERPRLFRLMFSGCLQEPTGSAPRSYEPLLLAVSEILQQPSESVTVRESAFAFWCLVHGRAHLAIDGMGPPVSDHPADALMRGVQAVFAEGDPPGKSSVLKR